MLKDSCAHRPTSKSSPVSKVSDLAYTTTARFRQSCFCSPAPPGPGCRPTDREAECKDGPGPTAYTAELEGDHLSPPPSFPSCHPGAGSLICRLGTLQASDGSCRARNSYYLSLAGSSTVHAQIEQKRNQILSCCQLALFHCLHQESSLHSQEGSAGSANRENTFVSLPSPHFQTDL